MISAMLRFYFSRTTRNWLALRKLCMAAQGKSIKRKPRQPKQEAT